MIAALSGIIRAAHTRAALWLLAFACGLIGCLVVFTPYVNQGVWLALWNTPPGSAPLWWCAAIGLGAAAQISGKHGRHELRTEPAAEAAVRWDMLAFAVPFLVVAYLILDSRRFTLLGVLVWVEGVALLTAALASKTNRPLRARWHALWTGVWKHRQTALALGAILIVAVFARFYGLADVPAELTSDQIEKLYDVQALIDGNHAIFFGRQQDREAIHIYLLAALSPLTGGPNAMTLKLGAALESVAGIAALYGFGHALIGDGSARARRFGLLIALMGAVGYWHLVVTRASLRIMLAPLITTLIMWALVRVIRHHRRSDAVLAGLCIGLGFYGYQALRIAPVLAVLATALAVLAARGPGARRRYASHLLITGIVAAAVCLPIIRFAAGNWPQFWSRLNATVLDVEPACADDGEACAQPIDPVGRVASNLARTALMFTYRGDAVWTYNAPGFAALDPLAGALFVCGLGGWAVCCHRRRDPVGAFVLAALVVMLLPGAAAIARPGEVPSATRSSGAMPMVYAVVAFGLLETTRAAASLAARGRFRRMIAAAAPAGMAAVMLTFALAAVMMPFDYTFQSGRASQREIGQFMRDFAEAAGTWGNAYFITFPNELDFRGVMIEAGEAPGHFPQVEADRAELLDRLYINWLGQGRTVLDDSRDLLFVFSVNDGDTGEMLLRWFPNGEVGRLMTRQDTPWIRTEPVMTYTVPAPGFTAFHAFVRARYIEADARFAAVELKTPNRSHDD